MMELADMRDLGSRAERRAGSTPVTRTKSVSADFLERSNRHNLLLSCRCGGMVDTADLKSSDGSIVPVRVRPPAPNQIR